MSVYPHPVVGAFIINNQNEILLVHSPKWQKGQVWTVPGGHIEWGETIKTAVEREAKEEVGLKVKFDQVFTVFEVIFPETFHEKMHFIFLECRCHLVGNPKPQIDNLEITEARWFNLNKALSLPLEHYTQKALTLLSNQ